MIDNNAKFLRHFGQKQVIGIERLNSNFGKSPILVRNSDDGVIHEIGKLEKGKSYWMNWKFIKSAKYVSNGDNGAATIFYIVSDRHFGEKQKLLEMKSSIDLLEKTSSYGYIVLRNCTALWLNFMTTICCVSTVIELAFLQSISVQSTK